MKKLALCFLLGIGSITSSFAEPIVPPTPIGPSIIKTTADDKQIIPVVDACHHKSQSDSKYGCVLSSEELKKLKSSFHSKSLFPKTNYSIYWWPVDEDNFKIEKGFHLLLIPVEMEAQLNSGYLGT